MLSDDEKNISFTSHAFMVGLNVFCIYFAVDYSEDNHLFLRGMHVSGDPALITVLLFSFCTLVMDFIYIKGVIKQCRKDH